MRVKKGLLACTNSLGRVDRLERTKSTTPARHIVDDVIHARAGLIRVHNNYIPSSQLTCHLRTDIYLSSEDLRVQPAGSFCKLVGRIKAESVFPLKMGEVGKQLPSAGMYAVVTAGPLLQPGPE